MLGYSTSGHVLQIVFGVIIIAAIVLTLMRKRYGLISLLLIAVSEMFVTYQPGSMMSFSYHMGVQVTEFVFSYGMFLIAMLQEGRTLRMGFNANLRELCTRVSNQEWGEKRRLR